MERYVNTKDILDIVINYCKEYKISLSKYAQTAGISRSWLSRLITEENKKITLEVAQQLLSVSGYTLKVTNAGYEIKKISRLGKINEINK